MTSNLTENYTPNTSLGTTSNQLYKDNVRCLNMVNVKTISENDITVSNNNLGNINITSDDSNYMWRKIVGENNEDVFKIEKYITDTWVPQLSIFNSGTDVNVTFNGDITTSTSDVFYYFDSTTVTTTTLSNSDIWNGYIDMRLTGPSNFSLVMPNASDLFNSSKFPDVNVGSSIKCTFSHSPILDTGIYMSIDDSSDGSTASVTNAGLNVYAEQVSEVTFIVTSVSPLSVEFICTRYYQ